MLDFSSTIARITILEALRSRLLWAAAVAIGIAFASAQFLSQVAIIEVAEIQLSIMASLLRVTGVFLVGAFCITSLVRESNDKIVELFLSQPAARWQYYAGKITGFAGVSTALAIAFALPLAIYAPLDRVALWAVSFACELLIVASISFFCAVSLSQLTVALAATAGFYLLGRSVSAMQIIAATPITIEASWTDDVLKWLIDGIALFMPMLDRMTLTEWLLQQPPSIPEIAVVTLQTCIYVLLIGAATLVDLYRKNF